MSVQNVKEFYQLLLKDQDLYQRVVEVSQNQQGKILDDMAVERLLEKEILPLAEARGLSFTLLDLQQAVLEAQRTTGTDELSDGELAAIAGGTLSCLLCGVGHGDCFVYGQTEYGEICVFIGYSHYQPSNPEKW